MIVKKDKLEILIDFEGFPTGSMEGSILMTEKEAKELTNKLIEVVYGLPVKYMPKPCTCDTTPCTCDAIMAVPIGKVSWNS